MNADQLRTLTEIGAILPRVVSDLERLGELREEIRGLPAMDAKLEELYKAVFIGTGTGNEPLTGRITALEKDMRKAMSRRGLGPRERAALYTALLTALAVAVEVFANGK